MEGAQVQRRSKSAGAVRKQMNGGFIPCAERPCHAYPILQIAILSTLHSPSNQRSHLLLYLAWAILQIHYSTTIFTVHQAPDYEIPIIYAPSNIRITPSKPHPASPTTPLKSQHCLISLSRRAPHSICRQSPAQQSSPLSLPSSSRIPTVSTQNPQHQPKTLNTKHHHYTAPFQAY